MTNEGEALVQAFKSGQVFYTLVAWKAVPEINGNEPKIVKQALTEVESAASELAPSFQKRPKASNQLWSFEDPTRFM